MPPRLLQSAPSSTLFLDESKARAYIVVVAVVVPADTRVLRRTVEDLRMRGQRRLHFAKESDPRRRLILSSLRAAGVRALAYEANEGDDLASRALCLTAAATDARRLQAARLVLEQDDSIVTRDRQLLYRLLQEDSGTGITYSHARAAAEPLLAIPDALAWAIARGGEWRHRVDPMLEAVTRLG